MRAGRDRSHDRHADPTGAQISMRTKSRNAAHGDLQATTSNACERTADVAAFVAQHGLTICPPGQTSRKPKKPVSAKRRKLRQRAANRQRAFLQRKGRADWGKFKKEYPQVARERLEMLNHFRSI